MKLAVEPKKRDILTLLKSDITTLRLHFLVVIMPIMLNSQIERGFCQLRCSKNR
jgi:hypothetical protein